MRVESFLLESARRFPAKTALVAGPERLSYEELAKRAAAFASHLAAKGLQRGERVVIFLHNSPEAVTAKPDTPALDAVLDELALDGRAILEAAPTLRLPRPAIVASLQGGPVPARAAAEGLEVALPETS